MKELFMPELFVGCSTEILAAAKAIQNNLQHVARVTIWTQDTFRLSRITIQEIKNATIKADYAVFILAPDDLTVSRDQEQYSPRDNTLFEAGFFMGALGIERVFILKPRGFDIKLPTDLLGVTPALYEMPKDGRWEIALGPASNKIEMEIRQDIANTKATKYAEADVGPHCVYPSLKKAAVNIGEECYKASDIKIISNKGFTFLATDDSVLSAAELHKYKNLRKLRVLLLSPNARWITRGFIADRGYQSVEAFVNEVRMHHQIVEIGFEKFSSLLSNARSGVRYYDGEPYWRLIMTENTAFVSSYADEAQVQVKDLPVARFDNVPGSFYHVFKRYFNDIWHNHGVPSQKSATEVQFAVSAGGIVYAYIEAVLYVALLKRTDGYWVLPKGHQTAGDSALEETASREVAEELGIDPKHLSVEDKLAVYEDDSFASKGESKIVHIYSIRYSGSRLCKLNPDIDHAEAIWWDGSIKLPEMLYKDQKTVLLNFIKDNISHI